MDFQPDPNDPHWRNFQRGREAERREISAFLTMQANMQPPPMSHVLDILAAIVLGGEHLWYGQQSIMRDLHNE